MHDMYITLDKLYEKKSGRKSIYIFSLIIMLSIYRKSTTLKSGPSVGQPVICFSNTYR